MQGFRRVMLAGILSAVPLSLIPSAPAVAHEGRPVGKFLFVVGWGDEPAYTGQKNSVQLILSFSDKPVVDLTDTLKVEVSTGTSEKRTFTLEPNFEVGEFGTPGDYRAFFVPTQPGKWKFHLVGTVKGARIDQTFESKPDGFSEVEDPATVQFPSKVPSGTDLSARLDRELPRIDSKLTATAKDARDDASTARLFGIIGTALGAIGVAMGGVALTRKR